MIDLLLLFGISIVVAAIGNQLYERIGIPESVLMIMLGLVMGPVLLLVKSGEIQYIVTHIFTLSLDHTTAREWFNHRSFGCAGDYEDHHNFYYTGSSGDHSYLWIICKSASGVAGSPQYDRGNNLQRYIHFAYNLFY